MSNGQVTGGTVRYLQRVKTGDYEHKEAEATINFSNADGQQDSKVFDFAASEAHRKVGELLLGAPKNPVGRPPKVRTTAETAKTTSEPMVEATTAVLAVTEPEDPFEPRNAMVEDPTVVSTTQVSEPVQSADVSSQDEWAAEAKPITDKQITDACAKRNAELIAHGYKGPHGEEAPQMIRTLVNQFVPAGQPARSIPADQRQRFLDELANLGK